MVRSLRYWWNKGPYRICGHCCCDEHHLFSIDIPLSGKSLPNKVDAEVKLETKHISKQFNLKTHPTLRAVLLIFTTLPAASLTLGSFIYAIKLNNKSPDVDTIETWTCGAKNEVRGDDIQFSPEATNEGFSRLCTESVCYP